MEQKILALLAKAEGTDNEHERDAFTKKAQALMLKHGVDEAVARARAAAKGEQVTEQIITLVVPMKTRYARGLMSVGFAVTQTMPGLRGYKTQKHNSEEGFLYVVGFETDVKHAVQLIESLKMQAMAASVRWAKSQAGQEEIKMQAAWTGKTIARETWKGRRNFITYFASGVRERIQEVWGEVKRDAGASTEVAIRDRQSQVDAWLDSKVKLVQTKGHRSSQSGAAAGRAAGRQADVGGRGVAGGGRSALGR